MTLEAIQNFYNATAKAYTKEFLHELEHKPFDRHLLERFANKNKGIGLIADLGCGPGQTTRFLYDLGLNMMGIDLSEEMITHALNNHVKIQFEQGNILDLEYPDNHFSALVAFYAIVHFDAAQLKQFFSEALRLLKPGGQLIFSFHTGTETISIDELLGVKASADFHFHDIDTIRKLVVFAGFNIEDVMIRYPYPEIEYPSKRCYIIATK